MKILVVIPARGGSKRLPGKNIQLLGGKPLIEWTIELAKQLPRVVDIIVSTDDHQIARIATCAGATVPGLRPAYLATDGASTIDVCIYELDCYEGTNGKVDGLLLLQPTSPYCRLETLERAMSRFAVSPSIPLVAVSPVRDNPYWCFRLAEDQLVPLFEREFLFKRSQDLPVTYIVSGSFYLISPNILRKERSLFPSNSQAIVITSEKESIDIDTTHDWIVAESYLNQKY